MAHLKLTPAWTKAGTRVPLERTVMTCRPLPHVEVEARVRMRQPTKQMMEFTREVAWRRESGWL
jgi:hypothetical protein